jgi:hypothetical protein
MLATVPVRSGGFMLGRVMESLATALCAIGDDTKKYRMSQIVMYITNNVDLDHLTSGFDKFSQHDLGVIAILNHLFKIAETRANNFCYVLSNVFINTMKQRDNSVDYTIEDGKFSSVISFISEQLYDLIDENFKGAEESDKDIYVINEMISIIENPIEGVVFCKDVLVETI